LAAWNLLRSNIIQSIPSSIADWFIAYDLSIQRIQIPSYKSTDILFSTDEKLYNLSKLLILSSVDKERILRILGYLKHLDNDIDVFGTLPDDAIQNIMLNLDCQTILLICKLSTGFSAFCQRTLDNILKEKLFRITRFNVSRYDKQRLINMCKVAHKSHTTAGFNNS